MEQVEEACRFLAEQGILPSIVRYSLAASAMDTANMIGKELKVGRDRLVPEFTFMDPRAVGKWDMLTLSSTEAAVWAMDTDEAGAEGRVRTTTILHAQSNTFFV
jgi:broad specificity phosphatase PhoE